MKFKIVADSSCDLKKDYLNGSGIGFDVVPFVVNVGEKEFVDIEDASPIPMLDAFDNTKERSFSACASPQSFYEASQDADYTFIVTISSQLSGSFNSACVAREMAKEDGKNICVVDSTGTGGMEILIIDKLVEMIKSDLTFEEISSRIYEYVHNRQLLFVLRSFENLIRNGRMKKVVATIARMLNITPICESNKIGEIEILEKIVGDKKAIKRLINMIGEYGIDLSKNEIIINYCQNEQDAYSLKEKLMAQYPYIKNIRLVPMKILNSFYAMKNGLIISF